MQDSCSQWWRSLIFLTHAAKGINVQIELLNGFVSGDRRLYCLTTSLYSWELWPTQMQHASASSICMFLAWGPLHSKNKSIIYKNWTWEMCVPDRTKVYRNFSSVLFLLFIAEDNCDNTAVGVNNWTLHLLEKQTGWLDHEFCTSICFVKFFLKRNMWKDLLFQCEREDW